MTTIQQLESINYADYSDNPHELFGIAKQLLSIKKFEKAIETLEKGIHLAVKKYGSENHIECARFYDEYADALIRKMMELDDILAIEEGKEHQEAPKEKKVLSDVKENQNESIKNENIGGRTNFEAFIEENQTKKNSGTLEEEEEDESVEEKEENDIQVEDNKEPGESVKEEQLQQKEESDEQIAYENLIFANMIYTTYLQEYQYIDPNELRQKHPEVIQYYFQLSSNFQKFGELEQCKSDFKKADEFFQKALDIRKKYDDKYSRHIAELYFNEGSVLDFDALKCLHCYYKTKLIMEHHLKEALIKLGHTEIADKFKPSDSTSEFDSNEISISSPNLLVNKELIESEEVSNEILLQNEDIAELVSILTELHQKIEDVTIDIKEFEKFIKEKKTLETQNTFTDNYDKNKVMDINSTGIIRKRARIERVDENKDDNVEEGGKKEKIEETARNNNNNITQVTPEEKKDSSD